MKKILHYAGILCRATFPVTMLLLTGIGQGLVNGAEVRLKELAEIQGVRGNQLFGYGLVVGLRGTGDKTDTVFTSQSLNNMLVKMGIAPSKISRFGLESSGNEMKVKNVAAVLVTAELLPFVRPGTKIDVTLSSIGDSNSLEGGTLVMTPLQGADGKVYAVAQGPVSVGGLRAANPPPVPSHPTVGYIASGAFVERMVAMTFINDGRVVLRLRDPDFTVASRVVDRINSEYTLSAWTNNSGSIDILIPEEFMERPAHFISTLEQMTIMSDTTGRIVINERTGTIVTGEHVVISRAAVSHGSLTVTISPDTEPGSTLDKRMLLVNDSVSVGDIARNLNELGATPTDMIAIFQAMKRAGAIKAELQVM